jgi:signal transduction histidine kinase
MTRFRTWLTGVRPRTTVLAVLVVGLVLALVLVVLAQQTRNRLERTLTSTAETRAGDLALQWEDGRLPDLIPGVANDVVAQVILDDGTLVATSPGLEPLGPFADLRPAPGVVQKATSPDLLEPLEDVPNIEDEGPYRIVARGATGPEGTGVVFVAVSLESSQQALGVLRPLLLIGFPFLLLAVGATVWLLTGRALQPVEAMRREADAISVAELDRRLPVPESRDEVHRLAVTLNDMLERLEASTKRQRRFVSDASHELKSPVAAIRAMIDVAEADPDFDDWQRLLEDVRFEDERLERLVSDLLALARWDEGYRPPQPVDVDLDHIAGMLAGPIAATHGVSADLTSLGAARVSGDPRALETMVRNILDNAARHAKSAVWVETGMSNGTVQVAVSDDGPGVDPGDRDRVFERFVRLDEGRSRSEGGTGLGLAVSRAIAQAHGGSIEFVDGRYEGATVVVTLPPG